MFDACDLLIPQKKIVEKAYNKRVKQQGDFVWQTFLPIRFENSFGEYTQATMQELQ